MSTAAGDSPAGPDATASGATSPDAAGPSAPDEQGPPETRSRRLARRAVPLLKVTIAVAALWYLVRLLRRVDWPHVGASLGHLAVWQIGVLLLAVVVRQTFNAGTLALFVPRLSVVRAVMNDLTANLVSTVAPPPSDIVLRMAMFKSWDVPLASATSGLTLNTVTYFAARFSAPALGFLIALAGDGYHPGYAWTAFTSGLVALAIVAALVAATSGERAAAALGRLAGRLGHRMAPSRVDPHRWEQALVTFQAHSGEQLRRSSGRAALILVGLLTVEALLLVLCLRFVGVPASQAPVTDVLAILLVSYPLTALPLAGLGVLDTAVAAVLTADGSVDASAVVAGLVIWRVCLLLVPLLLGAGCLVVWRRGSQRPAAVG